MHHTPGMQLADLLCAGQYKVLVSMQHAAQQKQMVSSWIIVLIQMCQRYLYSARLPVQTWCTGGYTR